MRSILALAVVILITITRISAHPGHGNEHNSMFRHISGSPLHLAEITAGLLLVAAGVGVYWHRQKRRLFQAGQR